MMDSVAWLSSLGQDKHSAIRVRRRCALRSLVVDSARGLTEGRVPRPHCDNRVLNVGERHGTSAGCERRWYGDLRTWRGPGPRMVRRVLIFFAFLRRLFRRLTGVGIARTAASLAFTTLLGLVPLFTVAFSYVTRFPMFERWQDALESFPLRYFLLGSGTVVRHYLAEFTEKSSQLKGVGTFFVILTAVLLVVQIDQEINAIWGGREPRSVARRIVIYALGFTAGPALIGAA